MVPTVRYPRLHPWIDHGAALGPWYGGGVVHGAPFLFPLCSPSVCQVFTFCLPSVHLLFAECSPSVCRVFTFCLPSVHLLFAATFKANSNSKRQARYRRLHVASQRWPFATLRLYESILTRCAFLLCPCIKNKATRETQMGGDLSRNETRVHY